METTTEDLLTECSKELKRMDDFWDEFSNYNDDLMMGFRGDFESWRRWKLSKN
jgi:hypothetical protein